MNDIIYKIILSLATAGVAAIVRYMIPLIITQLRQAKHDLAADVVEKVVRAVEQMITKPGAGEERYEKVLEILHVLLPEYHIYITDEQIQILIESVVETINAEKPKVTEG